MTLTGAFKLSDILPWGRNRAEYSAFFDLGALDRETRILDCGGGPSSFNAEMTRLGYRVTSADPLYRFSEAEIAGRVGAARAVMEAGLREVVRVVFAVVEGETPTLKMA